MSLERLLQALQPALAGHPEIQVGELVTSQARFVTLKLEPPGEPHRYMRIAYVPEAPPLILSPVYAIRWGVYRNPVEADDVDGSTYGDLTFTASAVQHWLVDRLPYAAVTEFKATPRG